jgi:methionyl-tRNA formyltransferase
MTALTIVGFASGSPLSEAAMLRIARDHHLAAIVVPRRPPSGLRALARRVLGRAGSSLARLNAPLIDIVEVARFRPELIVVASFPKIIPVEVLAASRLGALNMHMSLLPRHRGPDPLFCTYWHDDRDAGVTLHWMSGRVDAGDIVARHAMPLERGLPSREAYMRLTAIGVELLTGVLGQIVGGHAPRVPQDDALATYESAAEIARARIPFAEWPSERVWHVLSGLGDQFSGLVADVAGQQLTHGRAAGYRLTSENEPGRIAAVDAGYELHCRDGIVAVERRRW